MNDEDNNEVEYGLVLPFVVCTSKGGPYDDDAYVAGWEAGRLDMFLAMLVPVAPGTVYRPPQSFHTDNQKQLDLIAMEHGLVAEFETIGEGFEGWVNLTLSAPVR